MYALNKCLILSFHLQSDVHVLYNMFSLLSCGLPKTRRFSKLEQGLILVQYTRVG